MAKYVSFFVPSKSPTLGAINIQAISPTKRVTQVAPDLVQGVYAPSPVSSGVAGRILALGPLGIIALVAAAGAAGYLIVKATTR